jgi:hypothetical protein
MDMEGGALTGATLGHRTSSWHSRCSQCMLLACLLVLPQPTPGQGGCHLQCNQRGMCISNNSAHELCVCDHFGGNRNAEQYQFADCSKYSCPKGKAWFDFATADNTAHADAECSNMGTCNEATGICLCRDGYTGAACDKLTCPGSLTNGTECGGNGRCVSMTEMGDLNDGEMLTNDYTYNLWDADKIFGCVCGPGWGGYDCSKVAFGANKESCPTGDNPMTTGQVDEVQVIDCVADGGTFMLGWRGKYTNPIPYNVLPAYVQYELNLLSTIKAVSVTVQGSASGQVCETDGAAMVVTFTNHPGDVQDIYLHAATLTDTTLTTGTLTLSTSGSTGTYGGTSLTGTKEDVMCSNQGFCNHLIGTCECFEGFGPSDGAGGLGTSGDCGYMSTAPTDCFGDDASTPGDERCGGSLYGTCGGATDYTCNCLTGYEGANCQDRTCPTGAAWFEEPTAVNTAHASLVPCSNRGTCDLTTGVCFCAPGFSGAACATTTCFGTPECGGKGTCSSIATAATAATDGNNGYSGNNLGVTYNLWDASSIYGCVCTRALTGPFPYYQQYVGYSCAELECPRGDNPKTLFGRHETQKVSCIADGGTFTLSFRGKTTAAISYNAASAAVEAAIETSLR